MQPVIPSYLQHSVAEAGKRLGRTLDELDWPNGGKNAPAHELNALLNLHFVLSRSFDDAVFYSEGTMAQRGSAGRIDLMGRIGNDAFGFEAKSFGRLSASEGVLKDLCDLRRFWPSCASPIDKGLSNNWWEQADNRWGVILVSSFIGADIAQAWEAKSPEEAVAILQASRRAKSDKIQAFLELVADTDLYRFAAPVLPNDRWGITDNNWLLCGVAKLSAVPPRELG